MTSSSMPKFFNMRAACGMVSFLKSAAVPVTVPGCTFGRSSSGGGGFVSLLT